MKIGQLITGFPYLQGRGMFFFFFESISVRLSTEPYVVP
jgi:hypothetical protein